LHQEYHSIDLKKTNNNNNVSSTDISLYGKCTENVLVIKNLFLTTCSDQVRLGHLMSDYCIMFCIFIFTCDLHRIFPVQLVGQIVKGPTPKWGFTMSYSLWDMFKKIK
jgi:hypothetical protein